MVGFNFLLLCYLSLIGNDKLKIMLPLQKQGNTYKHMKNRVIHTQTAESYKHKRHKELVLYSPANNELVVKNKIAKNKQKKQPSMFISPAN